MIPNHITLWRADWQSPFVYPDADLGRSKIIMARKAGGGAPKSFTSLEAAQLLLDEWKFRQAHCWRLLQRFGLAAILVSLAPYGANLIPEWRPYLPWVAWFGWCLELVVAWLFAAEYIRCQRKGQAYDRLLDDHWPGERPMIEPWRFYERPFGLRIGWVIVVAIFFISSAILLANLYVLRGWPF